MNLFDLDIEQLDPDEAKKALSNTQIERLPGVPAFLSKEDCATILGVSMKLINHLTESGQLAITNIPSDILPSTDLFGQPIDPPCEKCILRADLIDFMDKALLFNKPILNS
jgi:hypothetical protein